MGFCQRFQTVLVVAPWTREFVSVLQDWHSRRVLLVKIKIAAVSMVAMSLGVGVLNWLDNRVLPFIIMCVSVPVAIYILIPKRVATA
ncbi:MAG: hypothetical protein CBD27_05655 [Rhodospirillaceae bacterium TMED167]|nr:hypothetical protein [Rhodospirillaceae bacterium]OUW27661.1 MAG: hypothetical protein CBD27_05655 [Rhodospirillaceae bacterium TMED167]